MNFSRKEKETAVERSTSRRIYVSCSDFQFRSSHATLRCVTLCILERSRVPERLDKVEMFASQRERKNVLALFERSPVTASHNLIDIEILRVAARASAAERRRARVAQRRQR